MGDLQNPRWMWLKAGLLLGIGGLSAALLLLRAPSWLVAIYLGLAIWAFCRAYYFAFYVIEHYIDAGYKFSGLGSFVAYCLRRRSRGR